MTDAQWAVELVRRAAASHLLATPPNWSTPREHANTVPRRLDYGGSPDIRPRNTPPDTSMVRIRPMGEREDAERMRDAHR